MIRTRIALYVVLAALTTIGVGERKGCPQAIPRLLHPVVGQVSRDPGDPVELEPVPVMGIIWADVVDGYHASGTPLPGFLLALDDEAMFPLSVIRQGPGSGLDADTLDGYDAADILALIGLDSDTVDGFDASAVPAPNTLLALDGEAKFPNSVLWMGHGAGIDADTVDSHHASNMPTPNFLMTLGPDAKFTLDVIPHGPGSGLDADTVDGMSAEEIQANADKVDDLHASITPTPGYLLALGEDGMFPLAVIPQGPGSGLDADTLDGLHVDEIEAAADVDKVDGLDASATPTPGYLLALGEDGLFPLSVIPQGPGSGLNADLLDGLHAFQIGAAANVDKVDGFDAFADPTANALLALDGDAKFPLTVLHASEEPQPHELILLDDAGHIPVDAMPTGLDADTLDGKDSSEFALGTHTHEGEDITSPVGQARNADALCGAYPSNEPAPNHILVLDDEGKFPAAAIHQGEGSTLDSDTVDGYHAWELMANEQPDHSHLVWLAPTNPQPGAEVKLAGDSVVLSVTNTAPAPGWAESGIPPQSAPPARYAHAMAHDSAHGVTLLYGGRGAGSVFYGDTWLYDAAANAWTQLFPETTPGPLYSHAMVYNKRANLFVLFGGHSGSQWKGETWVFDPSTGEWSQCAPGVTPDPRSRHAMVYDDDTGLVVLFGGGNAGGLLGDTWLYDTAADAWFQVASPESPPARHLHAMAYDPTSHRTILFGGYLNSVGASGDTWAFDGIEREWSQISADSPPGKRYEHRMAFDRRTQRVVMFGGYSTGYLSDTWTFDGATDTWALLDLVTAPPGRQGTGMVYDSTAQSLLVFGGYNGGYLNDTWLLSLGMGRAAYFLGEVHVDGNVYAETRTGGAIDLAEYMPASETVEPGDVVVIDPERDRSLALCRRGYDTAVAGVVSTKPSYLMGVNPEGGNAGEAMLALAGRVPCKVDARYGPVRRGDLLTSSPTPGHAMRATDPKVGTIIGKALQTLEDGTGVIEVLLSPR